MSGKGTQEKDIELSEIEKLCFTCTLPAESCGLKSTQCAYTKAKRRIFIDRKKKRSENND